MSDGDHYGLWHRTRERGVLRVAASYAVIPWLTLQIADVTFEPLGAVFRTPQALGLTRGASERRRCASPRGL